MRPFPYLRVALVLACLLAPAVASAQTVQKCRDADGAVSYRSAPCRSDERTLATWPAVPDDVEPRSTRGVRRRHDLPAARPRTGRASARVPRAKTGPDPCADARQRRERIERREGLARDYELLVSLSRDVFEACR